MGATWLFGLLAANDFSEALRTIFSWLFVICNTLQVSYSISCIHYYWPFASIRSSLKRDAMYVKSEENMHGLFRGATSMATSYQLLFVISILIHIQ